MVADGDRDRQRLAGAHDRAVDVGHEEEEPEDDIKVGDIVKLKDNEKGSLMTTDDNVYVNAF